MSWRRDRFACVQPRPATLLGKGQVEEIAGIAKEQGAGLLVVDAALTPDPAEEP